jgi:flagellar basal body-associated protein FliL
MTMASQDEPNVSESGDYNEDNETKYMWIAVGVIVVIILGGMGINMLVHHETNAEPAEISTSQSAPQQ